MIHARGDDVIDFDRGVRLYDRASQPKLRFWIGKDDRHGHYLDRRGNPVDHNTIIFDDDAAGAVRLFFEGASRSVRPRTGALQRDPSRRTIA